MNPLAVIIAICGTILIVKGASASSRNSSDTARQYRIKKAYAATGKKTKYGMGHGGRDPTGKTLTETGKSDCSGFASYLIGVKRSDSKRKVSEIETTNIYNDARGARNMFVQVDPAPGVFCVYPDRNGEQGHMGLVTKVSPTGGITGVDCGSGNYKRTGDAIQERSFAWMMNEGAIFVAPKSDYSDLVA